MKARSIAAEWVEPSRAAISRGASRYGFFGLSATQADTLCRMRSFLIEVKNA